MRHRVASGAVNKVVRLLRGGTVGKEGRAINTHRGFTLIELLIVVAIIGIIAAIAIPNLVNAINRGRQKRTMADIRSIASAIEAYAVDQNAYPKLEAAANTGLRTQLLTYLEPTYIRRIPDQDGWSGSYYWIGNTNGTEYSIWSGARNKNTTMEWTGGPMGDFNADIVFAHGQFAQWPDGVQSGT